MGLSGNSPLEAVTEQIITSVIIIQSATYCIKTGYVRFIRCSGMALALDRRHFVKKLE